MNYTFYKIGHPEYPELIYIGSTKNYQERKMGHKDRCYNENDSGYNVPLYQFIRNNNIIFEELYFEIICSGYFKTEVQAHKYERYWVESYDTYKNGLNERLPYRSPKEKIEQSKQCSKQRREQNRDQIKEQKKQYYEQNKEQINTTKDITNKIKN